MDSKRKKKEPAPFEKRLKDVWKTFEKHPKNKRKAHLRHWQMEKPTWGTDKREAHLRPGTEPGTVCQRGLRGYSCRWMILLLILLGRRDSWQSGTVLEGVSEFLFLLDNRQGRLRFDWTETCWYAWTESGASNSLFWMEGLVIEGRMVVRLKAL
jgi:hypothetical protein